MRFVNNALGAAAALGLLGLSVVQLADAGATGPGGVRTAAMAGPWNDSGWQGPVPMAGQANDSGWQ